MVKGGTLACTRKLNTNLSPSENTNSVDSDILKFTMATVPGFQIGEIGVLSPSREG